MKITIEVENQTELQKLLLLFKRFAIKTIQVIEEKNDELLPKNPAVTLKRGSGKQAISYMAEDFKAPLSDFNDYM